MEDLVIVRRYRSAHEAHIACGALKAASIHAVVVEAASFDPTLNEAFATVLRVRERDLEEAEAVLAAVEPSDDDPEPGHDDTVRCPKCELEYCYFGVPRGLALPGVALIVALFSAKRWRCTKCEHVWEDAEEGPKIPSRFELDDPRPVFYLKRSRTGTGVFWGAALGFLLLVVLGPSPYGIFLILAGGSVGWIAGRSYTYGVCSDAQCRARLKVRDTACPRCKKTVAGTIHRGAEHYAALAEVRREFSAMRERDAKRRKPKKKRLR